MKTRQMIHRVRVCVLAATIIAGHGWLAGPLVAAVPQLGGMAPFGAQRGTEVEVQFNGDRFTDGQEILFYEPGITVTHLEAAGANAIKTKLQIAADCRLGLHQVRVRTASGVSNLRTFSVGAMAESKETEPNNDFAQPQKITLDMTVNGVVENEDVDYFAIEVKKGERITAEIEGLRLGNFFFDPYVAILDTKRFELGRSDDAPLVRQDSICSIVAPEDGTYIVQVRETSFSGNGACLYRLHVGRFPRPLAVYPLGAKPGDTLDLQWLGDVLGARTEKTTLPAGPTSLPALATIPAGIFARDDRGISPSSMPFRLTNLNNVLEVEPNNSLAEGTPGEAPVAMNGVISQPGDIDCFKFAAKKGQVFDVRVLARSYGSPLDSIVSIIRIGGAGVAANDDSGGPDSYQRFTAPEDDTYVIHVQDQLKQGGAEYVYRVEVTPVQPTLTLGVSERSQFVDIVAPVPRGNRFAFLINAQRADFGGELKLEWKDLPAGVTVETLPMAANRSDVPVLLTAAADAPLAGALIDVVGQFADANQKIEGHLRQRTSLVRGQNNIEVWNQYSDRLASAVTQETPFKIEIVEPKVPLVRDGAMNLKVVATRKEGFNTPIAVQMLYNPPGVGSSGSIVIPEGKTEALIPLTANSGAEVNKWKIVVLGDATVGDGPVTVASQMATLEVSEPFVAFNFQAATAEQGQNTEVLIKVEKKHDFEGAAKVELLGLPNEVTAEPREITKDSTELVFAVKTTANSPAGKHKTVICRATMIASAEPIVHTLGTGELRIDTPLPPKANQPAAAAPMPAAAAAAPAEKRLSPLEKLRLERQQAKAAAKAAGGMP
ncbi:MAG TPA: PPC domain-containing protein [Pirellulales bacterium]|nr:PPC domain-containing protein [Pirellulales bacterium]